MPHAATSARRPWRRSSAAALTGLLLLAGCSVKQKKTLIAEALDEPGDRREAMEASLRVFDENPKYVDEMFRLMLEHPATLNRFLAVSASGLDDPRFAALMAKHLVRHPESLAEVFVQLLEAAKDAPEARRAMAGGMQQRPALVAETVLAKPEALTSTMVALVDALQRHPKAQPAFLAAMRERKDRISALLLSDKETLTALMGAVARQGDDALGRELRELFSGEERAR